MEAEEIARRLGLAPHPEGGFYRETWRAAERTPRSALPDRYDGPRAFGTAIYYLLTPDTFSAVHRVASDELFHFYMGDPVEMLLLPPDGPSRVVLLGTDLDADQEPQVVVPRGWWQGCRLRKGGEYALMGTTVCPGFDFADFELGDVDALVARYPEHARMIDELTLRKA